MRACERLAVPPAHTLRSALAEVRAGREVDRGLALALIACDDAGLDDLLDTALEVKERFRPGVLTYSRKVFVPLTTLCRDRCRYCTFRRDPGAAGAHTMSPEEVLMVARAGERAGCREALFSLGDKPERTFPEARAALRRFGYRSTLRYLEAMCALVLRETQLLPHVNAGPMNEYWLARFQDVSPSMGLMVESTSRALTERGSAHDRAPDKRPEVRLATLRSAGHLGLPFTTGLLVGIGESRQDRVETLLAIRDVHRRYGNIQEVIVQNFTRKPGIDMAEWPEPSRGEMLRTLAVARLLLSDVNLQAPPNLLAPAYADCLRAGINDWGGISPVTPDFINPQHRWPHIDELERETRRAGNQLRLRLPVYPEYVPRVVARGGPAGARVATAVDPAGYACNPTAVVNDTVTQTRPRLALEGIPWS